MPERNRLRPGQAEAPLPIIEYPHFKKLHGDIKECREMSRIEGEPKCMALTGVTGAGKSTLVRKYAAAFPRRITETHTIVPVLYVETPSPVTVKGVCSAMLNELGDPAAYKGTLNSMVHRLEGFLLDCDVELVILDEFHHLIDSETNRILEKVSEWLKSIIKKTGVPFLVVGIEGKVESILHANPQLSRLFPIREQVRPLSFEPVKANEFVQFIIRAEEAVDLSLTKVLPRHEILFRLHYVSNGVVGHVMNMMHYAAFLAGERNSELVDLSDLCRAFDRRIANVLPEKANPFGEKVGPEFHPPARTRGSGRRGSRKANSIHPARSLSDALRAR
jgi:Cdc6-like AAA superfamily ATPase